MALDYDVCDAQDYLGLHQSDTVKIFLILFRQYLIVRNHQAVNTYPSNSIDLSTQIPLQ